MGWLLVDAGGSSPLSRGILGSVCEDVFLQGIIPALAGNTGPDGCDRRLLRDHPRSRGEYKMVRHDLLLLRGSSPLSRGIRSDRRRQLRRVRIIPALAGNTQHLPRRSSTRSDHPRSRGEYRVGLCLTGLLGGSSPLSRGILVRVARQSHWPWIIPALAGNTRVFRSATVDPMDHPRSRGEYTC